MEFSDFTGPPDYTGLPQPPKARMRNDYENRHEFVSDWANRWYTWKEDRQPALSPRTEYELTVVGGGFNARPIGKIHLSYDLKLDYVMSISGEGYEI